MRIDLLHEVDHGFRERGEGRCIFSQVRIGEDESDEPASGHSDVVQYTSQDVNVAGHDEQSREPLGEITQHSQVNT